MDHSYIKTAVYGPGSIFDNYHQAQAHLATLSHWCEECKQFKSAYIDAANLFHCETCKGASLQPIIKANSKQN